MLFVEKDSPDPLQKDGKQDEIKSKTIKEPQTKTYKWKLVWRNIILYALMHLGGLYGIYQIVTLNTNWKTILWCELFFNNFTIFFYLPDLLLSH